MKTEAFVWKESTHSNCIVPSQLYEDYREQIPLKQLKAGQFSNRFQQNSISYFPERTFQQFRYQIKEVIIECQIVRLRIYYGCFQMEALVLVDENLSPFQDFDADVSGNYGSVHYRKILGQEMSIKSFSFAQQENISFGRMLIQWTILKICSALECAPKMDKYLGFDIVVFENSMILAMQKCILFDKINEIWKDILKEKLSLLHFFNIIHSDIKPPNIMFSPYFNTPVFIDFGFSTISKVNLGFKDKTHFKGTPKYCSSQMLQMVSSSQISYVDLYYNDCHCLKISIKGFYSISLKDKSMVDLNKQQKIAQTLIIAMFKFYYVTENAKMAQYVLKSFSKMLFKPKAAYLLKFISSVLHKIFLQKVLQCFWQYAHYREYQLVQRLVKYRRQHIQFEMCSLLSPKDQQNIVKTFKFKRLFSKQMKKSNTIIMKYQYLFNYLLEIDQSSNIVQNDLGILLICLSFSHKNYLLSQKANISQKWLKKIMVFTQTEATQREGFLSGIKGIFQCLLTYCNTEPLTNWKKDNAFNIIYQCLLLGEDVFEHFQNLHTIFYQNFRTYHGRMILVAELFLLKTKIQSINLLLPCNRHFIKVMKSLLKNLRILEKQTSFINDFELQKDDFIIVNLIKILRQPTNIREKLNTAELNRYLQQVRNHKIHTFFKYFINKRAINRQFYNQFTIENINKIIDNNLQDSEIDFALFISSINQYAFQLQLIPQYKKVAAKIRGLIDCDQMYFKFNIEKYLFLLDHQKRDKIEVLTYIRRLNQVYEDLQSIDLSGEKEISFLLGKIDSFSPSEQDLSDAIRLNYQKFSLFDFRSKRRDNIVISVVLFNLMGRLQASKTYMRFLPNLIHSYINSANKYWSQIKEQDKRMNNPDREKINLVSQIILNFEHTTYQLLIFQMAKDKENYLKSLIKLAQISCLLNIPSLTDVLQFRIIVFSSTNNNQQVLAKYVENFYKRVTTSKSYVSLYLNQGKHSMILATIDYYYQKGNYTNILNIFGKINDWIYYRPISLHVCSYVRIISMFGNMHPEFYMQQMSRRLEKVSQAIQNPYNCFNDILSAQYSSETNNKIALLQRISSNIQKLSPKAVQLLKEKYYQIVQKLLSFGQRKRIFLLLRHRKDRANYDHLVKVLRNMSKNETYSEFERIHLICFESKLKKMRPFL